MATNHLYTARQIVGKHQAPTYLPLHSPANSSLDNSRFLFPTHDPIVLTRYDPRTQKHQAIIVSRTTTFLPLDHDPTGALLAGDPTDHPDHLSSLLSATQILVHEKIQRQSAQAAAAAAAIERDFDSLAVDTEDTLVQAGVRAELRRRAYADLERKELGREEEAESRIRAIVERRTWVWEDGRRREGRRVEEEKRVVEEALRKRSGVPGEDEEKVADVYRFSGGPPTGILGILEDEAERDGEIMSEEQWMATIRTAGGEGGARDAIVPLWAREDEEAPLWEDERSLLGKHETDADAEERGEADGVEASFGGSHGTSKVPFGYEGLDEASKLSAPVTEAAKLPTPVDTPAGTVAANGL